MAKALKVAIVVVGVVSFAVLIILQSKTVVRTFRMASGSMAPALEMGDHVVSVRARSASRGDIITFRYPLKPSVARVYRVVAVGGDTVQIRDKKLFVNGAAVAEPYVHHEDTEVYRNNVPETYRSRDQLGPITVPAGHYFVLGDNRDNAADSRFWGTVPRDHLIGRVVYTYSLKGIVRVR